MSTLLLKNAPPLRLPGEHFAAALIFWLLGAAGLVWVAPDIAQGLFPLPRVVAVTHLFTLGWITTTIQGALYQFLPVALGVSIRSEKLGHLSYFLYVPGLALFVVGMALAIHPLLLTGAALFGTGLLLFAGNLTATLIRAPQRNLSWWALALATFYLVTTVVLGISLAGNLSMDYLGAHRFLALGVHLHVAAIGWVALVMVGVAQRLLPMFLLSHGGTERAGAAAVGVLGGGVGLLVLTHHMLSAPILWTVAGLIAAGFIAFIVQALLFFRHRKKPKLDPGLRLAGIALCFILCALVLAPFFLTHGLAAPRIATAYVLTLILGGLSLFVAGHYYKILPFLIWFHRFGPLVGKKPVPRVIDLYATRPGNLAGALLATGVAGLVIATLTGRVALARPAAVIFAAGALIVAVQMFLISRRRPT
jgi:hypothetical protein